MCAYKDLNVAYINLDLHELVQYINSFIKKNFNFLKIIYFIFKK